jgi:hypothetical protein
MHPIRSTALLAVAYDERRRVLTIQFRKNRAIYAVLGVPPSIYAELLARQPHPWTHVGSRVMRYSKVRLYRAA